MDVTDLVLRLLRRWIACVIVVVLAAVAAGVAWAGASTTQQSTAAVVIVPPVLGEAVSDQNPLLNLDNNLAQLAAVLASAMGSKDMTERAGLKSGTDADALAGPVTYTISTVTGTNPTFAQLSPQLVFTVTASDPGLALRTSTSLVSEAGDRLDALQSEAGTPFLARARLVTVVDPTPAEASGSGRLRAGGAVGIGVGVLGLLAVLLMDEMLTRRRPRRRPRRP